jgi:hypothetical protein
MRLEREEFFRMLGFEILGSLFCTWRHFGEMKSEMRWKKMGGTTPLPIFPTTGM